MKTSPTQTPTTSVPGPANPAPLDDNTPVPGTKPLLQPLVQETDRQESTSAQPKKNEPVPGSGLLLTQKTSAAVSGNSETPFNPRTPPRMP